jgi:hypothetical protein
LREYWLDVKDVPNYEVSNLGNVRNKKTGRILRQMFNCEGGYLRVNIGGRHRYVHRLVADAFFDGDHSNCDVNHIDGNRTNNFIGNLEWCTRQENIHHAFDTGLRYPIHKNVVRCKFCRNRNEYDICYNKDDDFFCAYGER